ncbi:MAG: phage holin family protein [Chroococcidiopsidaceae cyanobacterium CP_BM_ER_R8_30]|nr:phage holin family protein [Chroococcidiopsidaceae cyanobacterium CP_BM_ER_R8_30]
MPHFLLTWLVTAVALLITASIVPGFIVKSFAAALVAAVILGLVNAIVRPIVIFFTLPLTIVTLGLFLFVVNAIMLYLVSYLTPGFGLIITNFGSALLGSIVLAIVASVLNLFLGAFE